MIFPLDTLIVLLCIGMEWTWNDNWRKSSLDFCPVDLLMLYQFSRLFLVVARNLEEIAYEGSFGTLMF